ncbi:hypothetical protein [Paludibaculum fermentans]|uniref:hypothetical protein n=1 Tax=Paludibaculum fermentans TaxID=1473598 RepID=UPI003EBD6707
MIARALLWAGACAGICLAASPPEDLVQRAAQAPPEIAAWLLMKQATPERIPSKERRMAVLEEAFELASRASMPYPLVRASAEVSFDSVAGKRQEASLQNLDGLGLQVRAVLAMMNLSPARAQEMALSMQVPAPPKATCADLLVARVDEYYGLALAIARRGFTTKQREEGRPAQYLAHIIAMSSTPGQLLGAVRLVAQFETGEKERTALIAALGSALRSAPADPRSFAAVPELDEEVEGLVQGSQEGTLLASAYKYFVGVQQAKPCPADEAPEPLSAKGLARDLGQALNELRMASDAKADDWTPRFTAVLHRVEGWRPEQGQDAMEFFQGKAGLYRKLLDVAPDDALLNASLASYVGFLRDTPVKSDHPAEWMAQFRRMLQPWAPAGQRSVAMAREEIRRSGDAVMNLLADSGESF